MDQQRMTQRSGNKMQPTARVVGVVFLLVGVLGFIPGITTNYGEMEFAGHLSGALLLGVFAVSVLHNLVHLLFGVVGLVLAKTWTGARAYLVGGGVVYLLLWLYGLFLERGSEANFIPLNDADNWLHLALGVGMFTAGTLLSGERRGSSNADSKVAEPYAPSGRRP